MHALKIYSYIHDVTSYHYTTLSSLWSAHFSIPSSAQIPYFRHRDYQLFPCLFWCNYCLRLASRKVRGQQQKRLMDKTARPRATEPLMPRIKHSTCLQLTTMQQLMDWQLYIQPHSPVGSCGKRVIEHEQVQCYSLVTVVDTYLYTCMFMCYEL